MEARRPQLADLGVFLLVVAAPLVFTPFSESPFGDPKLVLVVAAALALWGAGLPVDRRLAWAGAAWAGATLLGALFGLDPSRGLTAQTGGEGGGLVVVVVSVVLLVAGAGADDALRERARRWFVAACAAIAVFAVLVRLGPGTFGAFGGLSFVGATMGNQIFGGALLSAGLACAFGARDARPVRQLAIVALLTLGVATFGERSALLLPVVAVVAFLAKARWPWRRGVAIAATVLLVIGIWQVVATQIPTGGRGATVALGEQATDTQRFTIWRVLGGRAVAVHPWLGWGPAMSQSAYLAEATEAEVTATTRTWADAHDLLLETLVTTGLLGLAALLVLLGIAGLRALRCPPERAWTFAAAAVLGVFALFEPVGIVLTPLLFFMLGAAGGPPRDVVPAGAPARVARVGAGLVLAAALAVSLLMLAGATLERWGRSYGEEWAYRAALRVQPWRVSATERLALRLAVDGRGGDAAAAAEARDLARSVVEDHPWDVDARVWAADVEALLRNDPGKRAWIAQQVARFPADRAGLQQAAAEGGIPGSN